MRETKAVRAYLRTSMGKDVPLSVRAFLTTRCNLRCGHCKVYQRKAEEMDTEGWKRAIDKLDELGTVSVIFLGGEPLLRTDLPEILSYSHRRMFTSIVTNGVLLRDRLPDIGPHLDRLSVSIDSFFQTGYGKTVNTPLLQELREASRKYGFSVQTICVLNRKNLDEVKGLIELAQSYGFLSRINAIHSDPDEKWMLRGNAPESQFRAEDIPKLESAIRVIIDLKRKGAGLTNFESHLLQIPRFFSGERWKCDAGRLYFDINPDGRIMPCQDLPPTDITINELNKGNYYKQIMEAGGARTVRECGGNCVYDCTWQTSHAAKHPLETISNFKP
jgi:pyrroloquinoline quinone biosynthesis protein E